MKDMRDFIEQAEAEGMLHRIKAEVDWDYPILPRLMRKKRDLHCFLRI